MLYSIIRKPLWPRQYWNRVSDIFRAARMQIKACGADFGAQDRSGGCQLACEFGCRRSAASACVRRQRRFRADYDTMKTLMSSSPCFVERSPSMWAKSTPAEGNGSSYSLSQVPLRRTRNGTGPVRYRIGTQYLIRYRLEGTPLQSFLRE